MFSRFRKASSGAPAPAAPAKKAGKAAVHTGGDSHGGQGFAAVLQKGVTLQPDRITKLKEGLAKGLEFFEDFNESRLNLAFVSFDEDMKKALYEVLFLLHVNEPSFAELKYTATDVQHTGGSSRDNTYEATANLYMENAPHGVDGLDKVSELFKADFHEHIKQVFGMDVPVGSAYGFCPIVSIHSLGSIGTVGHKSLASDLDLQVQYELEPFIFDTSSWTNDTFKEALGAETKYWINRYRAQQKLPPEALKDAKIVQGLRAKANQQITKVYPRLAKYLLSQNGDFNADVQGPQGQALRSQVMHELMMLMKRSAQVSRGAEMKKREALLKERINRVQDYIMKKYPHAEIYLFSASNDNYRKGHHGTTLESKESSGSAYEKILNYETLMPGIQLTPMVPTHFVLPKFINDDEGAYDRIVDYIRFNALDIYNDVKFRLVNLGATPDLDPTYVAKHSGAVYWEAFKASSGNLPKALLNLLRFDMLLDKRMSKTNIQILKEPNYLEQFVSPRPADPTKEIEDMVNDLTGLPPWALSEVEEKYPKLLQDPWWLRFKALKVGFHEEEKGIAGLEPEERKLISKIADLAFALHVRLSDVFTKPGDTRTFDTHREQVLLEFLKRAFPPISPKRKFLEMLFVGEINTVNRFEAELRELFKSALARVNEKIAAFNIQGESNRKEFEIWFHYYQENFDPPPNVVQRTIMNHLKVPRGNLQIGYIINEGWYFRSNQKESSVGKRFDTFGMLDHLPEEVILRQKSGFLAGLADAIINGYYGIINQGTLKETRTAIEFDAKYMDLGNRVDNELAYMRPDSLHRLLDHIIAFFPYQPYSYLDCINKKREISEIVIYLNMFKFGRLSILYRDNLRTWYCDEYEHADVFKAAHNLRRNARNLVSTRSLHVTLAKFFKVRGVNLATTPIATWVNPNSVDTNHSLQQIPLKEKELAESFKQIVMQVHGSKSSPEAQPAQEPAQQAPTE